MTSLNSRTKVFISYSHQDKAWLKKLHVHLRPLERDLQFDIWDDTKIKPGSKWKEEIKNGIDQAKVAVLLISANFLASDFIATDELPPLLTAAEEDGAIILPIILSPSRFTKTPGLSNFQAVNDPSTPLSSLSRGKQEAIFVKLTEHIENALKSTHSKQKIKNIRVAKLRFRDELWLDPLSVKLVIKSLSSGIETMDVEWPPATQLLTEELKNLLQELENYRESDSIFYGRDPDWVADIYGMANADYQFAIEMQRRISLRIPKIWQGLALDGEQGSYDSLHTLVFEQALPTLLALVNLQIQLHIALLIHANIAEKRERVPSHLRKWLNLRYPHNRDVVECLYGKNDPVYAIRFRVREVERYAYIPKSKLAQAYTNNYKQDKAHRNFYGWFHELFIPQIEWIYSIFSRS